MTEPAVMNHSSQAASATEVAKSARSRGQSQWELIAREFGKRRLAVVAACVILSLVTISIFAPLLANDRPLYYVGFNRFEYQEAARTLRGAIGQWSEVRVQAESFPQKLKDLEQAAQFQITLMAAALPAESSAKLRDLGQRLEHALKSTGSKAVAAELQALQRELPPAFDGPGYQEAARMLSGLLGQWNEVRWLAEWSPLQLKDLEQAARLQITLMAAALPAESSVKLRDLGQRLEQALKNTDVNAVTAELQALQRELRSEFDGRNVSLVTRTHWPVLASMIWSDIAFLVANILVLTWPVWSHLLRRWGGSANDGASTGWYVAVLIGLPLACSLVWGSLVPQRVDRTNYKSGVLASDDGEKKAAVVFQSVVWPPVAFGLDENDLAGKTQPPAWYRRAKSGPAVVPLSRWSSSHWLGTDELGRDILCRMIWGGRVSLSVGIVAVAIYVSIGIVVGSLAGYFRGLCDLIVSRIIEVVICFPAFFLILTIVALIGPGLFNIMVVIGLTGWTGIARLVRGEFLRLVDQEFVLAGRALGYSPLRLIFRHVLPNALAPVLVSATFGVAGAILTESALSFLGLGITVPTPSWGGILADGRSALTRAPWLIHFPGLAIFVTITSYNLVGEALRDAADPRLRGSR